MSTQEAVGDGWVFHAHTPWGELSLVLPQVGGAWQGATLQAAAALHAAEPRLQQLEDWLGRGLDLQPGLDEHGQPRCALSTAAPVAWACWADADAGALRFALPLARLREWPAPAPELQAAWRWQPVACEWMLASLVPHTADRSALEPGAAVVLPLSPAGGWRGALHALQAPHLHVAVEAQWEARSAQALEPGTPVQDGPVRLECVAAAPLEVPADRLAGWNAEPFELPPHAPPIALHARRGSTTLALGAGVLLPWFDTWALQVRELDLQTLASLWI